MKLSHIQKYFPEPCNLIVSLTSLEPIDKLLQTKKQGVCFFELRADWLGASQLSELMTWLDSAKDQQIPILFTLRQEKEGGKFTESDTKRKAFIQKQLSHPAIFAIDIELQSDIASSVIDLVHKENKLCIASAHFFSDCPDSKVLNGLVKQFQQTKADVLKLAMNLSSADDYHAITQFLLEQKSNQPEVPLLVVGMGKYSTLSRISFPALGSIASFCHLGQSSAPNQPSFKELNQMKKLCY